MNQQMKHWGIVGGGMLGLYLAMSLAEKGQRVTVLESKEALGGLAGNWEIGNTTWDKFYHVILLSDVRLRKLLKTLNLDDQLNWVETKTGFYTEGQLYSMSDTLEFLQFPPLSYIDKLRLGFTIFYASRITNWKALENIPLTEWLMKLSGKNTFEKIWLPLLRAKLGDHYKHTSATFIWTTIQRMYKARRTGLKKEMFGYVNGGYSRIISALKENLVNKGVEIKTGHPVKHINPNGEGMVKVTDDQNQTRFFDEVIVTVPSSIAAEMCQNLSVEEKKRHLEIEYLGVICASVLLKKSISPFYVTNITDQTPFTGIIEMTNIVDKKSFQNNSLVYLPRYLKSSNPIYHWKQHQIELLFKNSLLNMYPQLTSDDFQVFQVARAPYVFALPTINYSGKLPPISTSVPGLHILNSAHIVNGTLNVNETLALADKKLPGILQNAKNRELTYEPTIY
ncbi:MAG: FAD-dependent oxidoreductase [Bacteroidetes bacterium]|nr:MAG: FAD-dependent oxidoreductase [Bacteroidota bacterium]